jgi:hypothetical protein
VDERRNTDEETERDRYARWPNSVCMSKQDIR